MNTEDRFLALVEKFLDSIATINVSLGKVNQSLENLISKHADLNNKELLLEMKNVLEELHEIIQEQHKNISLEETIAKVLKSHLERESVEDKKLHLEEKKIDTSLKLAEKDIHKEKHKIIWGLIGSILVALISTLGVLLKAQIDETKEIRKKQGSTTIGDTR